QPLEVIQKRVGELEAREKSLEGLISELTQTIAGLRHELKEDLKAGLRMIFDAQKKDAGSKYERLAEELLAKAKTISDAQERIRRQWEQERSNAPDDRRREVDRIYKMILDQFKEQL